LWDPARKVGEYFLGSVALLERLIELESGVVSDLPDEIEIDDVKLGVFIEEALKRIETTNNTPLIALIAGVLEILMNLQAKIGGESTKYNDRSAKLRSRAEKVFGQADDYLG
jgi:hypothetical protein